MEVHDADNDVNRASRWLTASALVVFGCGVLAIILPLEFSVGIAGLLGCLFILAGAAHFVFGIYFGTTHWGWHASIAGLYLLAALNLLVNPLLGVLLLVLVVGVILIAEGLVEIVLFFILRPFRHAIWILMDGIITLALGIVACAHWPPDSLDIVQYFVGLSFIASGISRFVLAVAIRGISTKAMVEV